MLILSKRKKSYDREIGSFYETRYKYVQGIQKLYILKLRVSILYLITSLLPSVTFKKTIHIIPTHETKPHILESESFLYKLTYITLDRPPEFSSFVMRDGTSTLLNPVRSILNLCKSPHTYLHRMIPGRNNGRH